MITVGIPTVNGPQRLERCLRSVFSTEDAQKYKLKVFVLDDCSDPPLLEANKEICARFGVEMLMHQQRLGVPKGWNDLVNHTSSEYVILLNDDIEVTRYWIDAMYYTLKNNDFLGAVGYNAYEGPNRYAGNVIFPTYVESKLLFGSPSAPLLSCRGFAFGFRHSDFDLVGGFDERYFCFFEEVDFNLSLLNLGKRNAILSYPVLFHGHGETTTSVLSNPSEIFQTSKKLFEEKWETKWEDLRTIFNKETIAPLPLEINEWNTNVAIWV